MPDLKELLGEELYNQVVEKAGDEKVAVVSDGSYIPKEKFDEKLQEAKDYKQQVEERDNQLDELSKKAQGNEELTQQLEDLKTQNQQTKDEYEQQLQQQAFDHALDKTLTSENVRNPKAVKALLDMDTIKLEEDNLKGLDEQLNSLKENEPYLFESEDGGDGNPNYSTGDHQNPQGGSDSFLSALQGGTQE
ncbi:phage scaffolding protein [Alkalibacillus sp. S2W]|uniref:phage scaffolding protein n=1 Tax=Alkalibacillus sp. S2W TaxID=3386553 RepID=UPI00398C9415